MKKRHFMILGLLVCILAATFFRTVKADEIRNTWFKIGEDERTARNEEEFIQEVYEGMLSGENEITIFYYGKDYKEIHDNFLDVLLPKVFSMDDKHTSDDADYMSYNLDEVGINTKSDLLHLVTITITPKWKESKNETEYVDKKVKEIIQSLDMNGDSDYTKVKKIHDYVVTHYDYDQSLNNYTVFKAMTENKMICQGYMLLTYKLLIEAGVEAKCIDGIGTTSSGTQTHGWNLVKLGEYWYNLDTTWDDPVIYPEDEWEDMDLPIQYNYFLKGSISFDVDHERSAEYLTTEFRETYPVASEDFIEGQEVKAASPVKSQRFITEERSNTKEAEKQENSHELVNNLWISALVFIGLFIAFLLRKQAREI